MLIGPSHYELLQESEAQEYCPVHWRLHEGSELVHCYRYIACSCELKSVVGSYVDEVVCMHRVHVWWECLQLSASAKGSSENANATTSGH